MSEPGLTNPWQPWQRLIDSIGPYYRGRLFDARDEAKREPGELDDQELWVIAGLAARPPARSTRKARGSPSG